MKVKRKNIQNMRAKVGKCALTHTHTHTPRRVIHIHITSSQTPVKEEQNSLHSIPFNKLILQSTVHSSQIYASNGCDQPVLVRWACSVLGFKIRGRGTQCCTRRTAHVHVRSKVFIQKLLKRETEKAKEKKVNNIFSWTLMKKLH